MSHIIAQMSSDDVWEKMSVQSTLTTICCDMFELEHNYNFEFACTDTFTKCLYAYHV